MFALTVFAKRLGVRRKPCISRREGAAYARVQMVYFHEKSKRENLAILPFVFLAERQGFEPWYPVEGNTISSRAPSTTRPSLHIYLDDLYIISQNIRLVKHNFQKSSTFFIF